MKKIAVGIAVVLGFTLLQPVSAQASSPSIVIIDTAINSTLPELKSKVVYEVCMVQSGTCSNGSMNNEGLGSANLLPTQSYSNGFEHGTMMALVATQVNPNVNIIFIRIAGTLKNGKMATFSDVSITRALDWTIANKTKYNIVSVSASVGNTAYNKGANYCPIKAIHNQLINNIDKLTSLGVATMFATGNHRDKLRVNFPACIPQAIAVSAVNKFSADDGWKVSPLANTGPETDFYALGSFNTSIGTTGAFGQTSPATAALSAYWAKNYKGSYSATYEYLKSITSTSLKDFVNILG